jgi:uncharacterized protein (TIGR00251 family)
VLQYSQQDDSLNIAVRLIPRASTSKIVGVIDGRLKVRVAAPPVEGAANRELIRLLARRFKLPQNAVTVVSGLRSKNKLVRLQGADATSLEQLFS